MPRKFSTLLNVSTQELEQKGAFDGFTDIDSHLHVDPSLLITSKTPEFSKSYDIFQNYFKDILTLLTQSKKSNDSLWKEAHRRLQFKEMGSTALGYSKSGTGGNAIGPTLASKILNTANEIVGAGINDPVIFELVGLLEENIGADRISDMTISILQKTFAQYTERIAKELSIKTKYIKVKDKFFNLPYDEISKKEVILLPKELLNNLPIASTWSDIDSVCSYNSELRAKLNPIIGDSWKSAIKVGKKKLKSLIVQHPELLQDLISKYREKPRSAYDFVNDPLGEIIWANLSEEALIKYPLNLKSYNPLTSDNMFDVVINICHHFQSLIENNGWFEYLYDQNLKLKPERASQLLFYGIAEVYCLANDLDINREINAGIGSLDFKVSHGFLSKVNVELKYSTNPNLLKGIEKQLPAYNRAEKTDRSIYLIIQTKDNVENIKKVFQYVDDNRSKNTPLPEIIVIDGRRQVSASKKR